MTKGKLSRVAKANSAYRGAYYAARKSSWGGLWPHELDCGISKPAPHALSDLATMPEAASRRGKGKRRFKNERKGRAGK